MRCVHLPRSLDDLWAVLDREPDCVVYAGGTDVLVRLHHGQLDAPCLVALERVAALGGIEEIGDEIRIGATTSLATIESHPLMRKTFGVLVRAVRSVGSPPIRHMATLGGNVAIASPAADAMPALYVLGAEVELARRDGTRRTPVSTFVQGPGQVDLGAGEVVSAVWLRRPSEGARTIQHFEKVGLRRAQACAIVSLAALLRLGADGRVERARLAWGSVAPTVWTSRVVEAVLEGRRLQDGFLAEAARIVEAGVTPLDDVRATAGYRRKVAGSLLARLAVGEPRGDA